MKPVDRDANFTTVRGKRRRALGQVIHLTGRALHTEGAPVRGAGVEIWQVNKYGRYAHPSDDNPAQLAPRALGRGRARQ